MAALLSILEAIQCYCVLDFFGKFSDILAIMLITGKRVRRMTQQRQSHICGLLVVNIIINHDVEQRMIDYDALKAYGSRHLKQEDNGANLEWCSYPFVDKQKNEFICIGQFDDEDVLLQLNPFNVICKYMNKANQYP